MPMKESVSSIKRAFLLTLIAFTSCQAAFAQEGNWSQELGYYSVSPDVSSSTISGPGLPPATAVNVDDGDSFLLTTTYYQNENLSYEFFYSWWNELDALAAGSVAALGEIGTFEYLAPTLMVNWTFGDASWALRPHVGIGPNRMIYGQEESSAILNSALGGETSVKVKDTWGLAATAGITWSVSDRYYATLAYVMIPTDTSVTLNTPAVGTERKVDLDIDLDIVYLNVGYRF